MPAVRERRGLGSRECQSGGDPSGEGEERGGGWFEVAPTCRAIRGENYQGWSEEEKRKRAEENMMCGAVAEKSTSPSIRDGTLKTT